jgi:type I restriction enzyme S subunit
LRESKFNVGWLGLVPEHWIVAQLGFRYSVDLGKMLDGNRITGEHLAPYLRNVDVQWNRINTTDLPEMDFGPEERQRFRLCPGDLLVCEGGEVGRAAIWTGALAECFYQKALHRLRPLSDADVPRFMYYLLYTAAQRGVFAAESNPNTIDHLTAEKLRKHRFAFPPVQEQQAIAAFLDGQTARIDSLIAKKERLISLLEEKRAARLSPRSCCRAVGS